MRWATAPRGKHGSERRRPINCRRPESQRYVVASLRQGSSRSKRRSISPPIASPYAGGRRLHGWPSDSQEQRVFRTIQGRDTLRARGSHWKGPAAVQSTAVGRSAGGSSGCHCGARAQGSREAPPPRRPGRSACSMSPPVPSSTSLRQSHLSEAPVITLMQSAFWRRWYLRRPCETNAPCLIHLSRRRVRVAARPEYRSRDTSMAWRRPMSIFAGAALRNSGSYHSNSEMGATSLLVVSQQRSPRAATRRRLRGATPQSPRCRPRTREGVARPCKSP